MPWLLIIVLSARNGFGGNIEGGIAISTSEFQSQELCKAAAREYLQVNGSQGFFTSATCVQRNK